MKLNAKFYRNRQRGWTLIGGLMVLIILAFVVIIGFRVSPIYLDYFTVKSTLEALKGDPGVSQMSKLDIQKNVQRRFDVGYVDVVKGTDVKIKQDKKGKIVQLDYEDRRPLIANLEVVAKFSKTVYLY